jgi:Bromodomain
MTTPVATPLETIPEASPSEAPETSAEGKSSEINDSPSEYVSSIAAATAPSLKPLLEASLHDMINGLPRTEMKLIIEKAKECEEALEEELKLLQEALEQERKKKRGEKEDNDGRTTEEANAKDAGSSAVELMLESEVTPPDHYWTVSSLLGRLRHDLTTPLPPNSQLRLFRDTPAPPPSKKHKSNMGGPVAPEDGTVSGRSTPNFAGLLSSSDVSQFERLKQIQDHPNYKVEHENPDKLLTVWKKISAHRSSLVFRRPVNPKDAPGYSDRIHFPMDLSLIRKLIVNRTIRSYHDIALRIHLIGHNCVKYNGRESDYALVTREFESYSAEFLMNATLNHSSPGAVPMNRPGKKTLGTPSAVPSSTVGSLNVSTTTSPKEGIDSSKAAFPAAQLIKRNTDASETVAAPEKASSLDDAPL